MTAPSLREAATMALDALEVSTTFFARDRQVVLRAGEALRAALAQPDAEPYAYEFQKLCDDSMGKGWETDISRTVPTYTATQNVKPLYAAPQPAPLMDAEPVAVPAGWKLAPLEPTEEMIQAGCLSQQAKPGHENYADWFDNHSGGISERIRGYVRKDYCAMLAAHVPETNFGNMAAPVERKPLSMSMFASRADYDEAMKGAA